MQIKILFDKVNEKWNNLNLKGKEEMCEDLGGVKYKDILYSVFNKLNEREMPNPSNLKMLEPYDKMFNSVYEDIVEDIARKDYDELVNLIEHINTFNEKNCWHISHLIAPIVKEKAEYYLPMKLYLKNKNKK